MKEYNIYFYALGFFDATLAPACGSLMSPVNGSVDLPEATESGARANYSCDDGFKLVGPPTRTCERDGKWSGSPPTCDCKRWSCV